MKNILKNAKILIADDDLVNLQLLGAILQSYEVTVIVAKNGLTTLKYAIDLQPDLILMDVMMPEMDGYETCQQLKASELTKNIPVLFLTARSSTEDVIRGFKEGGVDYILKPFIEPELIARIKTHLTLRMNRKSMEELIRTKDKFFALIAHDLKNPFLNIVGYSEYIKDNIGEIDKEELVLHVNRIFESSFAQYRLLENLLEWSALQTGSVKVNKQLVNIDDVINDILFLYDQVAYSKQITLIKDVKQALCVFVDDNMLNTILRNLVSNAVKFTGNNKSITIRAFREESKVVLQVKDEGVGMPPQIIMQLFDNDKQLTNFGTQGEKGTGLGLKLCKEFVAINNGTIGVTSNEGEGSVFSIHFPVYDCHPNENI